MDELGATVLPFEKIVKFRFGIINPFYCSFCEKKTEVPLNTSFNLLLIFPLIVLVFMPSGLIYVVQSYKHVLLAILHMELYIIKVYLRIKFNCNKEKQFEYHNILPCMQALNNIGGLEGCRNVCLIFFSGQLFSGYIYTVI